MSKQRYKVGDRVMVDSKNTPKHQNLTGEVVELGDDMIRVHVQPNALGRYGGPGWFYPDELVVIPAQPRPSEEGE